jgi:very-short-patch-repair endonuclease
VRFLVDYWPIWVVAGMLLAAFLLFRLYAPGRRLPYRARGQLLSAAELRFYRSLAKAVQDDFTIFAMVRIADLLVVAEGIANQRSWLNKILSKHVDFVLCDPGSLQPKICLELDDRSHDRPDRIERDGFVDAAFESAGLPLIRIPVQTAYSARELREIIDQHG